MKPSRPALNRQDAQALLHNGGTLGWLPEPEQRGKQCYPVFLETPEGKRFLVSEATLRALRGSESAWQREAGPTIGNHRSPFGPGA